MKRIASCMLVALAAIAVAADAFACDRSAAGKRANAAGRPCETPCMASCPIGVFDSGLGGLTVLERQK